MSIDINEYGKQFVQDYKAGDFENTLTKYRKKFICDKIKGLDTSSILEIGCGMEPFNLSFDAFEKMVIVEPARVLYENALRYTWNDDRIILINDFIENIAEELIVEKFSLILCVGLIHEVDDPFVLLDSVRKLCSSTTNILFTTNNPQSFHILLGLEMGKIKDKCEISEKAKTFQRKGLFKKEDVDEMLTNTGFFIKESGSYFLKPFTHSQMKEMLDHNIINIEVLDGLDKMIKYLPDMGAENYWVVNM